MSIEEAAVSGAIGAGVKAIADAFSSPTKTPRDLRARLDILEAERLVLTIEARNELIRQCKALLPDAIRQAKGKTVRTGKGKNRRTEQRPGNAGLLRLISRTIMRNVTTERR